MSRELQLCPAAIAMIVLCLLINEVPGHAAERPNIVLIMCDDMGFSDIGCYGGEVATPNIDGLARDGMRFTQFYNNAKCTTTRASLITGLYPRRNGKLLKENMTTIAEVLRDGGYHTALSGKWHLGSTSPNRPSDRGFNEYYGLLDGCCNFFDPSQPDPEFKGGRVRWFGKNDQRITEFPADFYTTDAFSDYAVDVINRSVMDRKNDPFFLHVCYTAPHYPLHALPEDIAKYRGRYLAGWEALRQTRHRRQLEMGLMKPEWRLPGPDAEVTAWDTAEHKEWQDLRMAVYAAMIDRMDQGIGNILAALKAHNLEENTIVMFLSDNGGCAETPGGNDPARIPGPREFYTHCGPGWAFAQNTPFRRYKQWVHEGGISTPFIVRFPGVVSANSITEQVGHIIDVLPTCQALASAEYPTEREGTNILPTEGLDLTPVIRGEQRAGHEWLFWEWSRNRAVRHGQWKLCWDRKIGAWELYDLVADRTETRNLVEHHPDRLDAMSQRWFRWAAATGLKPKRKPSPAE
jgi:arylsulfatase A-like enzyme